MKETHKATILGKVMEEVWVKSYFKDEPFLESRLNKYEKITECELDNPPLNKGDLIYLHELDESAAVEKIGRSTENTYV